MKAEEYSKCGDNYLSERNFDKAIEVFTETIKLEPDNPFAYYKRGLSYTNKKEFDLAMSDFNAAINIEPNKFGHFYFDRAGAYIFNGDKYSAISDIEMAIKIDPNNKDYHEALKDINAESISNNNTKNVETIRKEINSILIRGIIGAVIGAILLTVTRDYSMSIAFTIIFGAWVGFGVIGNINFIPSLFKKGGFLFGWWESDSTFAHNIIAILIGAFIGYWIAAVGFMAFVIAGPIWPLIRIVLRKKQIKNICISETIA